MNPQIERDRAIGPAPASPPSFPAPAPLRRFPRPVGAAVPGRSVISTFAALLLMAGLGACGETGAPGSLDVVRDTLPGGAERVRYGALPDLAPDTLRADLRIGAVEGDGPDVFGQVRAVEADPQGRIYVLDNQAGETRIFGPDGAFLRSIARRGEGPGEVVDPNGLLRAPDGTLWVQDTRRWLLLQVTSQGEEVGRSPMFVRQFGFVWNATMDRGGRIWVPVNHRVGEFRPPEPGLNQSASRIYIRFQDPRSEAGDSVFVAQREARGWAVTFEGGGWGFRSLPWEPGFHTAVDPAGAVWAAAGEVYRIVRIGPAGDTLLVIEAEVGPEPVTTQEREQFLSTARERGGEDEVRIARRILDVAREVKPVIMGLAADEKGNVWVRRHRGAGDPTHYDVFDPAGDFLGSFQVEGSIPSWFPIRFREGVLYAVEEDEMDVQFVIRVPTPVMGG